MQKEGSPLKINPESSSPIYRQVADWIEEGIIAGSFPENGKVYSQYQLAELYGINPATAAKGLNLLSEEKILYKKRGLGMFVAEGAKETIMKKRRSGTLLDMIRETVTESRLLGITDEELIELIKEEMEGME
ncbi:GntR family transcriptional regulator [Edaphobacillus lindanitolerans]|uniref:DNA-binding transcriptional regulator YhcF, GntR family n=1 Tax=Edaphobacillus lindanitolerans TaxID=550447 RepID=A0A1U7PMF9_9BACI|nr:GntR family transcriptional regulator [Edaphobacillus lindanitolerans]SIT70402.1 DNA-binding transcriptional regulator YhcF, GntR family [Edaphobacillus lindanitolerans]